MHLKKRLILAVITILIALVLFYVLPHNIYLFLGISLLLVLIYHLSLSAWIKATSQEK